MIMNVNIRHTACMVILEWCTNMLCLRAVYLVSTIRERSGKFTLQTTTRERIPSKNKVADSISTKSVLKPLPLKNSCKYVLSSFDDNEDVLRKSIPPIARGFDNCLSLKSVANTCCLVSTMKRSSNLPNH